MTQVDRNAVGMIDGSISTTVARRGPKPKPSGKEVGGEHETNP